MPRHNRVQVSCALVAKPPPSFCLFESVLGELGHHGGVTHDTPVSAVGLQAEPLDMFFAAKLWHLQEMSQVVPHQAGQRQGTNVLIGEFSQMVH